MKYGRKFIVYSFFLNAKIYITSELLLELLFKIDFSPDTTIALAVLHHAK